MKPIFITGTGTDVGKTIVSVVVANALGAGYWKPVQAGFEEGTDASTVRQLLRQPATGQVYPELYSLRLPASPHLAAARENLRIDLDHIIRHLPPAPGYLVIEGAGGLCVPLNEKEFVYDLIKKLDALVILVSRNYLGSINHSLLTAEVCRLKQLNVLGWIFNDDYMDYQAEIVTWSGYPLIGQLPKLPEITPAALSEQAGRIGERLTALLEKRIV